MQYHFWGGDKEDLPLLVFVSASLLLALAGILWLISWSISLRNAVSIAAAILHGMAVFVGIAGAVVSIAVLTEHHPPLTAAQVAIILQEVVVYSIIPGVIFVAAAFELRFFWRSRSANKSAR
ncbi:MAG TPA: hypothetical protein VKS79_11590 [Gemmataceae bacterium]|nr:hypothetical protein [Gemmataceae bacterium]